MSLESRGDHSSVVVYAIVAIVAAYAAAAMTGWPQRAAEQVVSVAQDGVGVFMRAMTYIGNGPNFMVRAIAESAGVRMPSFFGYMVYSCLV